MAVVDSPLWRFVVGAPTWDATASNVTSMPIVTFLDHIATDKRVTARLNEPLTMSGSVPSDNPEVNIPYPTATSHPFLDEGTRVLWAFRQESDTPPYWVCRGAGIILTLADDATVDAERSNFVAYDPWQYLYSRPVLRPNSTYPPIDAPPASSVFPGDLGVNWTATRGDLIVRQMLKWSIDTFGHTFIDAGASYGGTAAYNGTIEATQPLDFSVQAGGTVGQAWSDLAGTGTLDIVLKPIYDPVSRPGYLAELSIYAKQPGATVSNDYDSVGGGTGGAGTWQYGATMSWDLPFRTIGGVSREKNGTERANIMRFHNGQGGPSETWPDLPAVTTSMQMFGRYMSEQFFPYQVRGQSVTASAKQQFDLVNYGREAITITPVPTVAPQPFLDYTIGDRVRLYASANLRAPIGFGHEVDERLWKRVIGIDIAIDDNAVERVTELTVLAGDDPPVETQIGGSMFTTTTVAVDESAKPERRRGSGQSWGGR